MSRSHPQHRHAVAIARAATADSTSPEHKRFRKLLDQIEAARQRLADWQQQAPLFAQSHAERVKPLQQRHDAALRAWAFEMEQLLLARKWSRADAATLGREIRELAAILLDAGGDDPELEALHDRHAEMSFEQEERQQFDRVKDMLEAVSGADLGDAEGASMDELMQRAHRHMAEQAQAQAARAGRPRKTRQSAAEKRAAADAAVASASVRDVYRKLASALHPDRAPADASAEQRGQRHAQMAQANAAYAAGDLLALLTLQLQIEQVDAAHVASVAAGQVRHFNRLLAEQLAELQAEIEGRELAFSASYGILMPGRLDPNRLGRLLKDAVQEMLAAEQRLQTDQRALRGAPGVAKAWMTRRRHEHRLDDFDAMPF
jgi:hypothetical protein